MAISNVVSNLNQAIEKYKKSDGSADFWVKASYFVRDACHQAAANLGEIDSSLPILPNSDPIKVFRAHTKVVANIMASNEYAKGDGDGNYWFRSYEFFCTRCKFGVKSLKSFIINSKVEPLLKSVIQNVINNLHTISQKYEKASGDWRFWMNTCGEVCSGMHQACFKFAPDAQLNLTQI